MKRRIEEMAKRGEKQKKSHFNDLITSNKTTFLTEYRILICTGYAAGCLAFLTADGLPVSRPFAGDYQTTAIDTAVW